MKGTPPTKKSLKKLDEIGFVGGGRKQTKADRKAFKEAFAKLRNNRKAA